MQLTSIVVSKLQLKKLRVNKKIIIRRHAHYKQIFDKFNPRNYLKFRSIVKLEKLNQILDFSILKK